MQSTNEEKSVKKLRCIQRSADRHWVGNRPLVVSDAK